MSKFSRIGIGALIMVAAAFNSSAEERDAHAIYLQPTDLDLNWQIVDWDSIKNGRAHQRAVFPEGYAIYEAKINQKNGLVPKEDGDVIIGTFRGYFERLDQYDLTVTLAPEAWKDHPDAQTIAQIGYLLTDYKARQPEKYYETPTLPGRNPCHKITVYFLPEEALDAGKEFWEKYGQKGYEKLYADSIEKIVQHAVRSVGPTDLGDRECLQQSGRRKYQAYRKLNPAKAP